MTQHPFMIEGADRPGPWLITCDHATNRVPESVNGGDLGLPAQDMARHIAYDVGAWGVALTLGEVLDSPVIGANFSRLVIDPNRGEDDPTLLMRLYDGSIIPANRAADAAERERRLNAYYRPYHQAIAGLTTGRDRAILSMHSFTPQLKGRNPRPWHIGILHTEDTRLSAPLIAGLERERDLIVGANEPYTGVLKGDAIDRHATAFGRLNALIEIRNDLIAAAAEQKRWATRLAPILVQAHLAARERAPIHAGGDRPARSA